MGVIGAYRMRLKRRRWRIRAFRKRRELTAHSDRTDQIGAQDVLLFATVRNEMMRLPYFLDYYRKLGIRHFLIVDNDSSDGTTDFLAEQPDVSLWTTSASYRRSRFGIDWMNWLLSRYGRGRWCLTVDADELLVFPFCDTRPIRAMTDWLDASSVKSFGAMMLDVYPKGPLGDVDPHPGQDPLELLRWFDSGNYVIRRNSRYRNLWIQGGARARVFFAGHPRYAPALNKIPLVKWQRNYVYVSSTHMLLPRGLNLVYDERGGEKTSGILLHTKLLTNFGEKALEELARKEHYGGSVEYKAYAETPPEEIDMWCSQSEQYINWRQLEVLGLMSKGSWA